MTRPMFAGTLLIALLSCARNPVTGKSELSLVSESQEIQMGQQASPTPPARGKTLDRYGAAGVIASGSTIALPPSR
jgi:hypothetical protein